MLYGLIILCLLNRITETIHVADGYKYLPREQRAARGPHDGRSRFSRAVQKVS
jgi:hypothetical protein